MSSATDSVDTHKHEKEKEHQNEHDTKGKERKKKKKKRVVVVVDPDADVTETTAATQETETTVPTQETETTVPTQGTDTTIQEQDTDLRGANKPKKKKKLKQVIFTNVDEVHPVPPLDIQTEHENATLKKNDDHDDQNPGVKLEKEEEEEEEKTESLVLPVKKKKKRVVHETDKTDQENDAMWRIPIDDANADRDYTYAELSERLFRRLRQDNPQIDVPKRSSLPPPHLVRATKNTIWCNFELYCKKLHRDTAHLQSYIFSELAVDGSLQQHGRLKLNGKYLPQQIEAVVRKYIVEYVQCGLCKASDTVLTRNSATRLFGLRCNKCQSDRTVAPIRSGFHATNRSDRRKQKQKA